MFPSQFGGKLVTFGLPSIPVQQVPQPCPRPVFISQVITESEFLTRSVVLQEALGSGNLLNYCQSKIQQASRPSEKTLWQFLKVGGLKASCSFQNSHPCHLHNKCTVTLSPDLVFLCPLDTESLLFSRSSEPTVTAGVVGCCCCWWCPGYFASQGRCFHSITPKEGFTGEIHEHKQVLDLFEVTQGRSLLGHST